MSWSETVQRFRALAEACRNGDALDEPWAEFRDHVVADKSEPAHLRTVLSELRACERDVPREAVIVLDHGTGTGINLFYLAALGYRELWGANVVDKAQSFNRVFREVLDYAEDRIFVYDGTSLPLADASVDLIVSQTVVEHLSDDHLGAYYSEEGRVLRGGGRAVHQVPHRLMPYDSHTCTWFIHYAPSAIQAPLYKAFANRPEQVGSILFLRWPWVHRRLAQRHIGPTVDRTQERLRSAIDIEDFDGPRGLRRFLDAFFNAPGIGALFRWLAGPLMMLESSSTKQI
ncbi:MAG: hypothetical protein CMB11_06070 [Euryarchaeota archaeon]|nr:hypothetical protein [Euryarchaeota archaeon]